jgi:hypothetical protein
VASPHASTPESYVAGLELRASMISCKQPIDHHMTQAHTTFGLEGNLEAAQIAASIGSAGGNNALRESTIGLFKTEVIKPHRPWMTFSQIAFATAEWIN